MLFGSAIANQESLSALETEMRKLEGVVKEIVDELGYLKKREERFQVTNSAYFNNSNQISPTYSTIISVNKRTRTKLRVVLVTFARWSRSMANIPSTGILQTQVSH